MKQLPNSTHFIIQHIKLWSKNQIKKPISKIYIKIILLSVEMKEKIESIIINLESTNISMTLEIEYVEPINNKSEHSFEIIKSTNDKARLLVNNKPEISFNLPVNNELKFSNEESNTQSKTYPSGYLIWEQRNKKLI
ncbi:hypothetical protein C2G38_2175402 [Gigaspora rosea]|uniref:Uncharacterized protein n=1 Tax=Gigaspora rosea TaxID=44941 RepID=A0A397VHD8_9GLOM|nr:hypothetical protein C2G38_2175402 [Gigaspora rosea]